MGYEVWNSGEVGRTKAEAISNEKGMPMDMPDGWKTKYGENFLVEKNGRTSECTGLKLEHEETCVPSNDGVSDVE